jgi:glycosyltransferase EpsD
MQKTSKILFVASTFKHLKAFHTPYIELLKNHGHKVDAAANDIHIQLNETDSNYHLPINRSPFSLANLKAIIQLRQLLKKEQYNLIHCHTAMGSVVARVAALTIRNRPKIIYTAHGFHFFKGGPKRNWLIYFPVEWILSFYTDALVTINQEDFDLSKRRLFMKQVYKINGVGVNTERFKRITADVKIELRNRFNFSNEAFVLIYAAEYISRKNHHFVIRAAQKLKEEIPNLLVLFAGRGALLEEIKKSIENSELENIVIQLGFVNNIETYYAISDIGISASRQEGLGLNLIEEMFCGLPVVASHDRGHREIIEHGKNGYLYAQDNVSDFVSLIVNLNRQKEERKIISENALESADKFKLSESLKSMEKVYNFFV